MKNRGKQITELLRQRDKENKKLLLQLHKLLGVIRDHCEKTNNLDLILSVLPAMNQIETALRETKKPETLKGCTGSNCRFVKNGTYVRAGLKVQNTICAVCKKPQSADKIRFGMDEYKMIRMVQLKLEGIPMSIISDVLGVRKVNLEYYWRALSNKTFAELDSVDLPETNSKRDSEETKYNLRLRKGYLMRDSMRIEADFMPGHKYLVMFPITKDLSIRVIRAVEQNMIEQLIQVRLAQISMMTTGRPIGIFGYKDSARMANLLRMKIKEIPRLPRLSRKEIAIQKIGTAQKKGKHFQNLYNLKFEYDQSIFGGMNSGITFGVKRSIEEAIF